MTPIEQVEGLINTLEVRKLPGDEFLVSALKHLKQSLSGEAPTTKFQEPALLSKFPHYYIDVRGIGYLDVYMVLKLFGVRDPCQQHAAKKILVAGLRGRKAQAGFDATSDIQEAVYSLQRWLEINLEERRKAIGIQPTT